MVTDNGRTALIICAAVLTIALAYFARSVFAPMALALFGIAVVWPVQRWLEARMPQLAALAISLLLTIIAIGALLLLSVWGVGQVGRWIALNAAQLQQAYGELTQWLEGFGIYLNGIFVEQFHVSWLVRRTQQIATMLSGLTGFSALVLVFLMLGLLEVRDLKAKVVSACQPDTANRVLHTTGVIAEKFRRYAAIRTAASVLTGLLVALLCWLLGIDLALAWGVLAFALNFIPFIGPFIATVLPAAFAVVQFQSWEAAVLILASSSVVQFLIGSYLEPRLSGSALSISPFLVIFAVFFGALLWGITGAFIGVPVAIAILTMLEQFPNTAWMAELMSGSPKRDDAQAV